MISVEYKNLLESINGQGNFGKRKNLPKFLEDIINQYNPQSILDFGCGVGSLVHTLKTKYPQKQVFYIRTLLDCFSYQRNRFTFNSFNDYVVQASTRTV
jgi:trans-aconitate methyltransferase